jgi:ATP-dependent DNA helicase PIF1
MSRLRGESKTYYAKDGGLASGEQLQKLLDNFMAQQVLHLTVGAQVMLIKNIDETLVNGSMGIVVAFNEPAAMYDRNFGGESQEETSKVGVVKAPALDESKKKRPVVDFNVPGGGIRQVMLEPETWKVELPNGQVQASRTQVRIQQLLFRPVHLIFTPTLQYPLILAWAMSIHKSQGQTLVRVKVDLAKVFEKGTVFLFSILPLVLTTHVNLRQVKPTWLFLVLHLLTVCRCSTSTPARQDCQSTFFPFAFYSPCCSGVCPRKGQGMERKVRDVFQSHCS